MQNNEYRMSVKARLSIKQFIISFNFLNLIAINTIRPFPFKIEIMLNIRYLNFSKIPKIPKAN
jgi:hypothetical protein